MDKWVNKVVIVTGASKGIGRAIAKCLASHGMRVVAVARTVNMLQELAAESKGLKGSIEPFQCDLGNVQDICKLFSHVEQTYKTLHACINNAGFSVADYFLPPAKADGTYDATRNEKEKAVIYKEWQRILNVDVLGLTICSKESINLMAKSGVKDGLIINVSSTLGQQVLLCRVNNSGLYSHMYNAVKFAVTTITADLRLEVQQHDYACGTRVMTLFPGFVKTDIIKSFMGEAASKAIYDKFSYATPEQVADAILVAFVCDPNVQITGLAVESAKDPKKMPFP